MASGSKLPPPPDGDVSSRAQALLAVVVVSSTIATASTVLRLAVRSVSRKLGWDDATMALATLLLVIQTVFGGLEYGAGFGRHQYYLTIPAVQTIFKWNFITEVLLFLIIPLTKISICLFVARIKNTGWLKWLLRGLIAGLVITTIVPIVVLLAECQPIYAFWDKTAGTCWNPQILNDVNYVQVGYSIASDLICSLLPVIILWKVQMRWSMKIAIWGLMSLGLIATACAAVRMSLFVEDLGVDLTYSRSLITIWCGLEETLGIICANLALSRYIYQFFAEGGWSRWSRKSSYKYGSGQQPPSTNYSLPRRAKPTTGTLTTTSTNKDDTILLDDHTIRKTTDLYLEEERTAPPVLTNMAPVHADPKFQEWQDVRKHTVEDRV